MADEKKVELNEENLEEVAGGTCIKFGIEDKFVEKTNPQDFLDSSNKVSEDNPSKSINKI